MAKVIYALLVALTAVQSSDLDHIKTYELVHLDISNNREHPILKFSAFSVDYKIELEPNHDLIPANIRHTNGNPTIKSGGDPYYTLQTETCHFFGKLLEPKSTSIISVSMCNKHGVRADIRVNGETLIIRPSALYLDSNNNHEHSFDDEHIVYKLSSPFTRFSRPSKYITEDMMMKNIMDNVNKQTSRQLLQENNSRDNKVEVLLLICESIQAQYKNTYGDSNWYETLAADLSTAMNTVSAIYQQTDWTYEGSNNIGSIRFSIVEFEVIEYDAPGFYYSNLKPNFWYSNCQDVTNKECAIDGGGWLDTITTWVRSTRGQTDTYDNIMMMHSLTLCSQNSQTGELSCGWAGIGKMGSMCDWRQGWGSVSNNRLSQVSDWYKTQLAYTMTHEAGHNFDLSHDQDLPGCNADSGLMGYGSVNTYFSQCSKKDLNAYFAATDLSCLANDPLPVISNYGPNAVNGRPSSAPTPAPIMPNCFRVSGARFSALDADYTRDYSFDDTTVYKANINWNGQTVWYLFPKWSSRWYIHNDPSGSSYYSRCQQEFLENCSDDPNDEWAFGATPCPGSATTIPTTVPTTANPTTSNPTTANPTTANPTTFEPTTANPTTSIPTTSNPTTTASTTNPAPTTSNPTTVNPTTAVPTTTVPTTSNPTTSTTTTTVSRDCWSIDNYGYTLVHGCYCYDSLDSDGNKVYSRVEQGNTIYLYNLWNYYWCVYDVIGSTRVYGYAQCAELTECTRFTAEYGCNPEALTNEDACYNEEIYNQQVCIHSNDTNTLFNYRTQFIVDNTCINDQPIYYWDFTNNKTNFTQRFYLHFDVTDEPRWIVSAFRVSSVAVAFCEEIDLFNCLNNSWTVISDLGDISEILIEPTMAIYNGQCDEDNGSQNPNKSETKSNISKWITIACCTIFVLLLILAILFVYRRKQSTRKGTFNHEEAIQYGDTTGQKVVLNDNDVNGQEIKIDESVDMNNTNEAEPEIEVDVEMEEC